MVGLRPIRLTGRTLSWLPLARASAFSVAFAAAILVALSVGLGFLAYRNLGTAPPTPSPATRQGPVLHPDPAVMPVLPLTNDAAMGGDGWAWAEGRDAALPLGRHRRRPVAAVGQNHWYIELAGAPPPAAELDPDQTIVEYGVVLDTNRDRVPDYRFGINNDAPEAGELPRVGHRPRHRAKPMSESRGHTDSRSSCSYPDEQDPDGGTERTGSRFRQP